MLQKLFAKIKNARTKKVRIKADPTSTTDKYITIKLERSYNLLEILSLSVNQNEIYNLLDSNYSVVAGRVNANGAVGIPNCRISVFIPLTDADKAIFEKPNKTAEELKIMEAISLYPFQTPQDVDNNGTRYNLLPKDRSNRGFNGFADNKYGIGATPKTPVGNMPEPEELLFNNTYIYLYEKYLKFTTVTNESGDYMLMLPFSNETVTMHLDCDITDIGKFSVSTRLLYKQLGENDDLFENKGERIKPQKNLDKMSNIESQNVSVFVKPFWTQDNNKQDFAGITLHNFFLNKKIEPYFTIMGKSMCMSRDSWWGDRVIFRVFFGFKDLCLKLLQVNADCNSDFNESNGKKFLKITLNFAISIHLKLGFSFGFRVLGNNFGFNINIIDACLLSISSPGTPELPCISNGGNGLIFRLKLCLRISNILPFFRFQTGSNYDRLNGSKGDFNSLDFIWLGLTGLCNTQQAINENISVTDSINIEKSIEANPNIRILTLDEKRLSENTIQNIFNKVEQDIFILKDDNQSINVNQDIIRLRDDEFYEYKENGNFMLHLKANREKVITNERGQLVISNDKNKGVFSSFRGFMYIDMNDVPLPSLPYKRGVGRTFNKIPSRQAYIVNDNTDKKFISQHYKFEIGEYYTVSQQFHVKQANMSIDKAAQLDFFTITNDDDIKGWDIQTLIILNTDYLSDNFFTVQYNQTDTYSDGNENVSENLSEGANGSNTSGYNANSSTENSKLKAIKNGTTTLSGINNINEAWIDGIQYFYHYMFKTKRKSSKDRVSDFIIKDKKHIRANGFQLGGGLVNTQHLLNHDSQKTRFIKLDKADVNNNRNIINIYEDNRLGRLDNNNNTLSFFIKGLNKDDINSFIEKI